MNLPSESPDVRLLDLDPAALPALVDILRKAGPRSRICRKLMALYGPLPRLTSRGVATSGEALSALAHNDLGRHLTSLDLSHTPEEVVGGLLPLLCTVLPELRALHLPRLPYLPVAFFVYATSQLRKLEALHVPWLSAVDAGALPGGLFKGWSRLRELSMPAGGVQAARPSEGAEGGYACHFGGDFLGVRLEHCASRVVSWQMECMGVGALQLRGVGVVYRMYVSNFQKLDPRSVPRRDCSHQDFVHLDIWSQLQCP